MTLLYRGHPGEDCFKTDETRGLSCTESRDVAKNYALDYSRQCNGPAFLTTFELEGEITLSEEPRFRGPDSFKFLVSQYSRIKHIAVKTACGTLVVVFDTGRLRLIQVEQVIAE